MDALRNALQPITHNLPAPLSNAAISLLGRDCYKTLILDIDPTHEACLRLALSKGLGVAIVGASAVVKLPQLLKLLNSQSSAGVSFLSYLLETAAFVISLAYSVRRGFPFSTFGETALIAVQDVAIAALVLHFGGKSAGAAVFVAGVAAAVYALFNEQVVDAKSLGVLQAGAGALGVASKVPQIVANFRQGGTGQLSAFAVGHVSSYSAKWALIGYTKGVQLPLRLARTHLYHAAGGRRQVDPVLLPRRIRAQPRPRRADGVLLEQPRQRVQDDFQARRTEGQGAVWAQRQCDGRCDTCGFEGEDAVDEAEGLVCRSVILMCTIPSCEIGCLISRIVVVPLTSRSSHGARACELQHIFQLHHGLAE